ncbi:MAG: methyltransferase domain-containing protein, partial [Thermodesulfovibrionales bacterium]
MDDLSTEYVISFFDRQLTQRGDTPEALRWSEAGQRLHYESLLDIGDINGRKILDYGCGKGDFCQFLRDKSMRLEYSGFDINKKLIALAKKKFPGVDFRIFDVEKTVLYEDFDFIFLCGVFNLNVQGIDESVENVLIKLFKHCRHALAFNALSVHNPKKDFELHYTSPEDIFSFAVKNISPLVSLRHDRMVYDFTLFIYRDVNQ